MTAAGGATVLVTGATGNLGSAVLDVLAARHTVIASDVGPVGPAGVEYRQADATSLDEMLAVVTSEIDLLVHLPAWHGIHAFSRRADEYWHLNVDGTYHALEAAEHAGVRRIVYASSAVFYGPIAFPYCFSKQIGEQICDHFRARSGMSFARLRYTNFTPHRDLTDYGLRLLDGSGLDRRDAGGATARAVDALLEEAFTDEAIDVVCGSSFDDADVADWQTDAWSVLARRWPEDLDLLRAYLPESLPGQVASPHAADRLIEVLGFRPAYDFSTFVEQLRQQPAPTGDYASGKGPAVGSGMSSSSTTSQTGSMP